MFDQPDDPLIERVAERLRRPVAIDPTLDGRVMAEVRAAPVPRRSWLARSITLTVTPVRALALAAGLAGVVVIGTRRDETRAGTPAVQFVLVAPGAHSVALVGDFNDWDLAATQLVPAPAGGLWTVTVPLPPGRYRYAFIVDGARWVPDPSAPAAADDGFGTPSSVVTVGG